MESPNAKKTGITLWKPSALQDSLQGKLQAIEEVLPTAMQGEAPRLVKRAFLTITRGNQAAKLSKCTMSSIVYATIQAAEIGLPIDGKLAYLVPYWNSKASINEAQCQPSYLGLTLVAKRSGQIIDAFPGMVYANDNFDHNRSGIRCHLEHNWDIGQPRGEPIAAYCVIELPGSGRWTYELMSIDELNAIRERSKSRDRDGNLTGPWVTDLEQMYLKTIVRRACKRYCSDPGFVLAVSVDEEEFADSEQQCEPRAGRRVTRSASGDRFMAGSDPEPVEREPGDESDAEPEVEPEAQELSEEDELASALEQERELERQQGD